jgi:hypothetical protein
MMLIGDSAYTPSLFVLPAFKEPDVVRDAARALFNTKHALTRNPIERAFGVLKQRWRVLFMTCELEIENLVYVVAACCVLHNICILHKCTLPDADAHLAALKAAYEAEFGSRARTSDGVEDAPAPAPAGVQPLPTGPEVRNAFVAHFKHVYQL